MHNCHIGHLNAHLVFYLQGREHPDLIEWLRFVDKEFESMLIDAEFISSSEDEPMGDSGEPIEEMHASGEKRFS